MFCKRPFGKTDKIATMAKHSKTHGTPLEPGTTRDTSGFSDSKPISVPALNLANHFLIAMPSMLDPVFGGTVIYLCEHNAGGALGVIINKPTDMTMDVLLERIDLTLEIVPNTVQVDKKPVMFGGPVQVERGFVLHAPLGQFSSMLRVTDDIALTTSKDVLAAVAAGTGPACCSTVGWA